MSSLGWKQLGDVVCIPFDTVSADGIGALPTATPTIKIWDASSVGAAVETIRPGVWNPATYSFQHWLRLGSSYAANKTYGVDVTYTDSTASAVKRKLYWFHTLPGGDATGAVIATEFIRRPEQGKELYATDDGSLVVGGNPR